MLGETNTLTESIVYFDIECDEDGTIYSLGALFKENFIIDARNVKKVVESMPSFRNWVNSANYLCGHNIISHDLPKLKKLKGPQNFQNKIIDTLYLSPIAFPVKESHRLAKEYKLVKESRNDAVSDSRKCKEYLNEIYIELKKLKNEDLELYACAFNLAKLPGMASIFSEILNARAGKNSTKIKNSKTRLIELFKHANSNECCIESIKVIAEYSNPLAFAYIHSWLQSASGVSAIPYWVCQKIPEIRPNLRRLRSEPCEQANCKYCRTKHNPTYALKEFFNFSNFRPVPEIKGKPGESLQEAIVSTAMRNKSVLGILPTGGGKSICFQLPALRAYYATGALSIVISPLQSLMRDQVENLKNRTSASHTAALYGLLTPVERKYCLHNIKMGYIGLLYISPEQLRSSAFKKAIQYREIAYWVFDEAHCLSKWGHDFRVDYLYASKFIKKLSEQQNVECPPIICVTATAKEDVKKELIEHFKYNLNQDLKLLDGGTERSNLNYTVEAVKESAKTQRIINILEKFYGAPPPEGDNQIKRKFDLDCIEKGAVVIFAARRKRVIEIYNQLNEKRWNVRPFHAGLENEEELNNSEDAPKFSKKDVLNAFLIERTVPIIVATNAFGMGVDKQDIRIVIHADATGSLENYMQEAGRAGRDGKNAECILLYESQDLETQFTLNNYSELTLKDLQNIWTAVYRSNQDQTGTITISTNEIREKIGYGKGTPGNYNLMDDTKIKAAVNILEDQNFLERTENSARVFEARLLVNSKEEARKKMSEANILCDETRKLWLDIVDYYLNLKDSEIINIEGLCSIDRMYDMYKKDRRLGKTLSLNRYIFRTLNSLADPKLGILKKDMLFSAIIRPRVLNKLNKISDYEISLIKLIEEEFPDQEIEQKINTLKINEFLCRQEEQNTNSKKSEPFSSTQKVKQVFSFLKKDGEYFSNSSSQMKYIEKNNTINVTFFKNYSVFKDQSDLRRKISSEILNYITKKEASSKVDLGELYEFHEEELKASLKNKFTEEKINENLVEILHYCLNWLHENKLISLQRGRALITSAMTINLKDEAKINGKKRPFKQDHFKAQELHYEDKKLQVHIVGEYANKAIRNKNRDHLVFIQDYFKLNRSTFIQKYFTTKDQKAVIELATGIESYNKIMEDLGRNEIQKRIVKEMKAKNSLVLAGPGSGKTKVIVHRCAWLLRVQRIKKSSIIILCFNRHAALELRRRIWKLIGKDAFGLNIHTFHGLALKLLGRTMAQINMGDELKGLDFDQIIPSAIKLLRSNNKESNEPKRQELLGKISHILVDEYQDIDDETYEFIKLLASPESDSPLTTLVVGDDDQSIYKFNGANVKYIKQFEKDYPKAEDYTYELIENYRSTKNIIAASNAIIKNNKNRKKEKDIKIDSLRFHDPNGGGLEEKDPIVNGKVQILEVKNFLQQAYACVEEIKRYLTLDKIHSINDCCIIARNNADLIPIRIALEEANINCFVAGSNTVTQLNRVREVYNWLQLLESKKNEPVTGDEFVKNLSKQFSNKFLSTSLGEIILDIGNEFYGEIGEDEVPLREAIDFFYEAFFDQKRRGFIGLGVKLTTAHKAKGLEFKNVFILDGSWSENIKSIDELEEERRLYYVATTRARESLTIFKLKSSLNRFINEVPDHVSFSRVVNPNIIDKRLLNYRLEMISLDDVYISYVANLGMKHPTRRALDSSQINDPVKIKAQISELGEKHLFIFNQAEVKMICLSKKGTEKWIKRLDQIIFARIAYIHTRLSDDGAEKKSRLNDSWQIPIVEVLYMDNND